jgi:Virulence factor membrane-bound polymerase, C-terminal/O-Antigen ligase
VSLHWGATVGMALMQRDTVSLVEKGLTVSTRFSMWPMLLNASTQSPWWGYGWLQVGAAQMEATDRHPSTKEIWMHAHNIFLELVLWCGYPLGLFLGGLLLYSFISRVMKVSSLESAIAMILVAIFGAHSLMELPYHYAYFLIPVGLWLGLVESTIISKIYFSTKASASLVALGLALTIGLWRDYFAVESYFRTIRFEELRIGTINPNAPDAPFLSALRGFIDAARIKPIAGMTPKSLLQLEQAIHRFPFPGLMGSYVRALALNHQLEKALRMCKKMRSIHGEEVYIGFRFSLNEAVIKGDIGLKPLTDALPP